MSRFELETSIGVITSYSIHYTKLYDEGIAIVLAVDLSSSMLAEDFTPANRLDVAKRTAIDFVRARNSDRIGLGGRIAQSDAFDWALDGSYNFV